MDKNYKWQLARFLTTDPYFNNNIVWVKISEPLDVANYMVYNTVTKSYSSNPKSMFTSNIPAAHPLSVNSHQLVPCSIVELMPIMAEDVAEITLEQQQEMYNHRILALATGMSESIENVLMQLKRIEESNHGRELWD